MTSTPADDPDVLAAVLRTWQAVEGETIARANDTIAKTRNPLVQLVMEIVRQDSAMHRRVQQALLDTLERQRATLTSRERKEIWDVVGRRAEMEKYTAELAERVRENCRLFVESHLLASLAEKERWGRLKPAPHALAGTGS